MQTIALVAQKGGTGKTTLALSLAVAAQQAGKTVIVVDLDPQVSACRWADRRDYRPGFEVMDAQPPRLHRALQAAATERVDLAIVDTPARVEQAALEAAKAADLVLIPCKPSILDLETVRTSVELVKDRARRPPIVVLNAVPSQGSRRLQAVEAVVAMGVQVLPEYLGHRVAFEYAAQAGQAVTEYEPDGAASADVRRLYASVCRILDTSTT